MTAAEARKQRWESLKGQPFTERLKYIFTYYWPGILGALCVVIFLVSWITSAVTQKEVAISGHLLNATQSQDYSGDLGQQFLEHQQIDSNKFQFYLTFDSFINAGSPDESYYALEALVTRMAVGDVDFLVAEQESYTALSAYYTDLRDVLSQQQLEQWKDLLVYVEKAALDHLKSDDFDNTVLPEYHMSAEGLTDPLPIGIRMPEGCKLRQAYAFSKGEIIFGIILNCEHPENAVAFLEYVLN